MSDQQFQRLIETLVEIRDSVDRVFNKLHELTVDVDVQEAIRQGTLDALDPNAVVSDVIFSAVRDAFRDGARP